MSDGNKKTIEGKNLLKVTVDEVYMRLYSLVGETIEVFRKDNDHLYDIIPNDMVKFNLALGDTYIPRDRISRFIDDGHQLVTNLVNGENIILIRSNNTDGYDNTLKQLNGGEDAEYVDLI